MPLDLNLLLGNSLYGQNAVPVTTTSSNAATQNTADTNTGAEGYNPNSAAWAGALTNIFGSAANIVSDIKNPKTFTPQPTPKQETPTALYVMGGIVIVVLIVLIFKK